MSFDTSESPQTKQMDKVAADKNVTYKSIKLLLGNIQHEKEGRAKILAITPDASNYKFPGKDGASAKLWGWLELDGYEDNGITLPNPTLYWKYYVQIEETFANHEKNIIKSTRCKLIIVPDLSGRLLDKDNEKDKKIVKDLVDLRNFRIRELDLQGIAKESTPLRTDGIEGEIYNYSVFQTGVQNLENEYKDILDASRSNLLPRSFIRKTKEQKSFYQSFPGGEFDGKKVNTTDRNGKAIETKTKVSFKSVYNNVDHAKAKWTNIRAKGQRFNELLVNSPSTIIKPIKTWVKGIGDVETLAISSLMAIYSIISLGDFNPGQPNSQDSTPQGDDGSSTSGTTGDS